MNLSLSGILCLTCWSNKKRSRFLCLSHSLSSSSSIFNCFVYLQGILHHISALSEKKGEAENSAKENKVPF